MKKLLLFSFATIIIGLASQAQNITNTHFEQKGNTIVVSYNIGGLGIDKTATVELYVSTDGGRTYKGPLKAVTGDIGEIETDGAKSIVWRVFDEYSTLEGDIAFEVRAKLRSKPVPQETFMAYNLSGTSALGLTYGTVGRWGWYARLKSNASFKTGNYTTNDTKLTDYDGEGYYTYTDQTKRTRIGLTAGLLHRLNRSTYLYAGAGYGNRTLLWNAEEFSYSTDQKLDDIWAAHADRTFTGAEIEAGVMLRYGKMNLSFGVNAVNFGFFELNGGFGIFF